MPHIEPKRPTNGLSAEQRRRLAGHRWEGWSTRGGTGHTPKGWGQKCSRCREYLPTALLRRTSVLTYLCRVCQAELASESNSQRGREEMVRYYGQGEGRRPPGKLVTQLADLSDYYRALDPHSNTRRYY